MPTNFNNPFTAIEKGPKIERWRMQLNSRKAARSGPYFLLLPAICLVLMAGCQTQVPQPQSYKFSFQRKMQAAHHWHLLAQDVAGQVNQHLRGIESQLDQNNKIGEVVIAPRSELLNPIPAIHVQKADQTPFDDLFYDLLLTHLVNLGLQVTDDPASPLQMTYKAQVLTHGDRKVRTFAPGTFSAIGLGIEVARNIPSTTFLVASGAVAADFVDGALTGKIPESEVIITVSLKNQGQYVMRKSDIYYIHPPDAWHYDGKPYKKQRGKTFQNVTQ